MERTIRGFIQNTLPYGGRIYGNFFEKAGDIPVSTSWDFDNEDHFYRFIRDLSNKEKKKFYYRGYKDLDKTELWKEVRDLDCE